MNREYDIAVIGAGSGGLVAAAFAARLGARVVLIEKSNIGGDCTWTGCVPSKALVKAARVAHLTRTATRLQESTNQKHPIPFGSKASMSFWTPPALSTSIASMPEAIRSAQEPS